MLEITPTKLYIMSSSSTILMGPVATYATDRKSVQKNIGRMLKVDFISYCAVQDVSRRHVDVSVRTA